MKEQGSTETSLNFYERTRRHVPEDDILRSHRRQMFKSRMWFTLINYCSDITPENRWLWHSFTSSAVWTNSFVFSYYFQQACGPTPNLKEVSVAEIAK
jgi:hypothetical protein